jgi:hypothetical protein
MENFICTMRTTMSVSFVRTLMAEDLVGRLQQLRDKETDMEEIEDGDGDAKKEVEKSLEMVMEKEKEKEHWDLKRMQLVVDAGHQGDESFVKCVMSEMIFAMKERDNECVDAETEEIEGWEKPEDDYVASKRKKRRRRS